MNSREVVTRAVEFRKPSRIPVKGFGEASDIDHIGYKPIKPPSARGKENIDEWLCEWGHTETPNMGQVKGHPLTDLSKMSEFPFPDGNDSGRFEEVPENLKEIYNDPDRKDKYIMSGIFMILWERMHSLHGFENCMMDLMDDKQEIHDLADQILEYDINIVQNMYKKAGDKIQGFSFSEDWGTENNLQISPDLFKHFFLPRYKILFKEIHRCGWHIWMHSCGKINKALPMLIEAGLDVVNMQQPRTNGIKEIGEKFAGKLCFESLCDIQKTLPQGNKEKIEEEIKLLLDNWAVENGGFVLGDYGDHEAIGADKEIKEYMLNKFRELDPFKKIKIRGGKEV